MEFNLRYGEIPSLARGVNEVEGVGGFSPGKSVAYTTKTSSWNRGEAVYRGECIRNRERGREKMSWVALILGGLRARAWNRK